MSKKSTKISTLGILVLNAINTLVIHAEDITDVMGSWGNQNKPDSDSMASASSWVSNYLGTLLSVIIWLIFAFTFLTSAIDLAYIALPMIRPMLWDKQNNKKLITADLVSIIGTDENQKKPSSLIVKEYLKKRTVAIVITIVILLLLVTTSVFTDLGLNLGQAILDFLGF
jgi:hypothetical protein